eukprot:14682863-Alexandrium_andersonii.AAC.1
MLPSPPDSVDQHWFALVVLVPTLLCSEPHPTAILRMCLPFPPMASSEPQGVCAISHEFSCVPP